MAFIVFEGLDGSGKSTLMGLFEKALYARSVKFVRTREPGGTPLAEEIRKLLLRTDNEVPHPRTELLLYEAARAQHVEQVIRPALSRGQWVISDRFTASTVAFQCYGRKLDLPTTTWLNAYATSDVVPELTVLIDVDVRTSQRRIDEREKTKGDKRDRFEQEELAFHERVRAGYLAQAQAPDWLVLRGELSAEDLLQDLIRAVTVRNLWPS